MESPSKLTPAQLALIDEWAPFARQLARQAATRTGADDGMLESAALGALLGCAHRYDPADARHASFQTYISHRIRGALLDAIRTEHISDGFNRARARHGQAQVQRVPWPERRSAEPGAPRVRWDPPSPDPDPEAQLLHKEQQAWALAQVTRPRDRRVLALRFAGYSQDAIGEMVGVLGARVSQLEARAVAEAKAAFDLLHPAA